VSVTVKQGFSLLELLVVILIMTILGSIVGVQVMHHIGTAKSAAAQAQIGEFKAALKSYYLDNGIYPTPAQGLQALCQPSTIEPLPRKFPRDGYMDSPAPPLDPWRGEFAYLAPGSRGEPFEIISYGKDGQPGGEDEAADVSSSRLFE
jgi:general secretion pathway protein G